MEESELYTARKLKARLAGLGYLLLAFAAWPEMVRRSLFITSDAAATSRNILLNLPLIRFSIIGDIVTEISFLFVSLCLYSLLKEVRQSAARAMLSMVVIAVTMTIFNTGLELEAINLFGKNDLEHGILVLGIFQSLVVPATFFFGLWMLPLGYLFCKSGFMPKTLGVVLMIGSAGYVIHAAFRIIGPGVHEQFTFLSVIAEIATIIWLLAFGVKRQCKLSSQSTGIL